MASGKRKHAIVSLMLAVFVFLCGCSKQGAGVSGEPKAGQAMPKDPVTLLFYIDVPLSDEEFDKFFKQPVKKNYPNVTLDFIRKGKGNNPEDLAASGTVPDVILAASTTIPNWQQLDMVEDLNPYLKEAGVDLGKFDNAITESMKMYSDKGETVGLPYLANWTALFYNKDIFDRMAVPYPKDLMTWDEAIELNRRLTRTADGVQYRGLDPETVDKMGFGLSLDYMNPKTGAAVLDTPEWKKVLETARDIFSVPGHDVGGSSVANFVTKRNTAMLLYSGNTMAVEFEKLQSEGTSLNWDMVTMPNFKEAIGTARELDAHYMVLNKAGKNKAASFRVMQEIVTDENQLTIVRASRLSSLKQNDSQMNGFAADLQSFKGKNRNAVFGVKHRKNHNITPFSGQGRTEIRNALSDILKKGTDVNTALREANERLAKYIQSQNAK